MAKQQPKRRRKRYQPGSAYAGDVRPPGFLGFLSSTRMIQVIFIVMALALAAGGLVGVLRRTTSGSSSADDPFAFPTDEGTPAATATADEGAQVKTYPGPPDMTIDTAKRYVAIIKTEHGDIEVELYAEQAPKTVNNFVFLAKDGFYDGLTFHYVEEGFSANAGDPACTVENTSCRGDGGPGYELDEDAAGSFEKGTLGMINGSQFLFALSGSEAVTSKFEEETTPFGQVISGLELLDQLKVRDVIESIEIREL